MMKHPVLDLARPDARSGRARNAAPVQPDWAYRPVRPAGAPEQIKARQHQLKSNPHRQNKVQFYPRGRHSRLVRTHADREAFG